MHSILFNELEKRAVIPHRSGSIRTAQDVVLAWKEKSLVSTVSEDRNNSTVQYVQSLSTENITFMCNLIHWLFNCGQ